MTEYTLTDLRVDLAEIKATLELHASRHAALLDQLEKREVTLDRMSEKIMVIEKDISRWKGAIGMGAFILTSVSSVLTTIINKVFYGGSPG